MINRVILWEYQSAAQKKNNNVKKKTDQLKQSGTFSHLAFQ